ncbi:hypothetical protein RBXJA2T_08265 [Rubrivivax benzoatilyticus JA2 = ATCC BAA-35]|nr:hypothetical protein RBXJA2T_08265 [Rubrivivax benzoatilyticus JA2 = ATCC BAA-35]
MSVTPALLRRSPTPCAPRSVVTAAIAAAPLPPGPVITVPWLAQASRHAHLHLVDTTGMSEPA